MQQQLQELIKVYEGLDYKKQDLDWLVYGRIKFQSHVNGELVEPDYEIKMNIPSIFPRELPSIWEVGGKIERLPKNHIYSDTGCLCLGTKVACHMKAIESKTILAFTNEQVAPFLAGYTYVHEYEGDWPYGELSHDDTGIFEYYQNYFRVTNYRLVLDLLYLVKSGKFKQINKHNSCVCGSGESFKKCCYKRMSALYKPILMNEVNLNFHQCLSYINRITTPTKISQSINQQTPENENIFR